MDLDNFFEQNHKCYDRFTFDRIFKILLLNDYSNEESKDLILFNCAVSSIIFQERIDNNFYKKIKVEDLISTDLQELKNEIFNSKLSKHTLDII